MRALPDIDYDAHPAYEAFRAEAPERREEALARLSPVLESKRRGLARVAEVFASRTASAADATTDELARRGAVGIKAPETLLGPVRFAASPLLEELATLQINRRAKGKALKFQHTQADLRIDGEWTKAADQCAAPIEALIAGSSVMEIARTYYPGHSARLHSACLRRNFENQQFFSRSDGADNPKTIGMHIDSAVNASLNGVIYLSEVGLEQGPFQYVEGSNHWDWDLDDRAIRKAVDEVRFPHGGDPVFLGLPPEFRRRGNFGVDLPDETPASAALLSQEITFCSNACDLVLFDSDGVHRGGNVRAGLRSSILFVMAIEPT